MDSARRTELKHQGEGKWEPQKRKGNLARFGEIHAGKRRSRARSRGRVDVWLKCPGGRQAMPAQHGKRSPGRGVRN